MAEEADGPEEGSESRPFFAITEADLAEQGEGQPSTQTAPETEMKSAEAVEGAEEIQDLESISAMAGAPTPIAIEVGSLGGPATMHPGTMSAPQLTGSVSSMNGMFHLQSPAEMANTAFRWGQFFLGLFLPWVLFFGFVLVAGALNETISETPPDFSRNVAVTMEPDENGWYVQTVDPNQGESLWFNIEVVDNNTAWVAVDCSYHPYDSWWEDNGKVIEISGDSDGEITEEVIGEYTESNQTVWFKINERHSPSSYEVEINYYDEEASNAWWDEQYAGGDLFESIVFCGGPVAFIIGTIAAFVRGNKALGIGLLCSIPMSFIMLPLLFVLLLLMFGF